MEVVALVGVALVVLGILWRVMRPGVELPGPLELRLAGPKPPTGSPPSAVAKESQQESEWAVDVENADRKPELARQREPDTGASAAAFAQGGADHSAPTLAPSASAQWQRPSERILLRIPVRVSGTDADGNSFTEDTFTLVVHRQGATVILRNSPRLGDQITVTNLVTLRSCPFQVCRSLQNFPGAMREWGVECLEPNPNFWQIYFPEKTQPPAPADNISVMLECAACHSREMAELSMERFRTMIEREELTRDCPQCHAATEWKLGFIESDKEYAFLPSLESEISRDSLPTRRVARREERLILRLRVHIKHEDGRAESTITENVSESGLCCASSMEMQVGDVVLLTGWVGQAASEADTPARIVWRGVRNAKGKTLYGMLRESHESPAT